MESLRSRAELTRYLQTRIVELGGGDIDSFALDD